MRFFASSIFLVVDIFLFFCKFYVCFYVSIFMKTSYWSYLKARKNPANVLVVAPHGWCGEDELTAELSAEIAVVFKRLYGRWIHLVVNNQYIKPYMPYCSEELMIRPFAWKHDFNFVAYDWERFHTEGAIVPSAFSSFYKDIVRSVSSFDWEWWIVVTIHGMADKPWRSDIDMWVWYPLNLDRYLSKFILWTSYVDEWYSLADLLENNVRKSWLDPLNFDSLFSWKYNHLFVWKSLCSDNFAVDFYSMLSSSFSDKEVSVNQTFFATHPSNLLQCLCAAFPSTSFVQIEFWKSLRTYDTFRDTAEKIAVVLGETLGLEKKI